MTTRIDGGSVPSIQTLASAIEELQGGAGSGVTVLFDAYVTADGGTLDTGANAIPTGFAIVEVILTARSIYPAIAVTTSAAGLQFNGDTGTNYIYQDMTAANATQADGNNEASPDHVLRVNFPAATATAGFAATARLLLHDYDNTDWFKQALLYHAMVDPAVAANGRSRVGVGMWKSTAAINQIKLADNSGNGFAARSRMTILGYK